MTIRRAGAPGPGRFVVLLLGTMAAALLGLFLKRVCHHVLHRRWEGSGLVPVPVPAEDAPWSPDIARFASTFDGYREFGGVEPLGDFANECRERWSADGALPDGIDRLRACLFFEQRRFRHFGEPPRGDDDRYVRALLAAIRSSAADPSLRRR